MHQNNEMPQIVLSKCIKTMQLTGMIGLEGMNNFTQFHFLYFVVFLYCSIIKSFSIELVYQNIIKLIKL